MSAGFQPPEHERGAALLTVLLLVGVIGALAAVAVDRMRLSTALAVNFAALEQARGFSTGIESLTLLTLDDMLGRDRQRTTLAGGWNGATRRVPLEGGGIAQATVRDGGNCFNLNSLVQGEGGSGAAPRPAGIAQFAALMGLVGVPASDAQRIAAAAADWADADTVPIAGGAEDEAYARREHPYRAANTLFAEESELRLVAGMTPAIYARIRPWLCALTTTDLSPINVNTLAPDQAPLLVMLAPSQLGLEAARRVLAGRPADGWTNMIDFWSIEALSEVDLPLDVQLQPQLRSQWFALEIRIEMRGAELIETALVDARSLPARIAVRRFGGVE